MSKTVSRTLVRNGSRRVVNTPGSTTNTPWTQSFPVSSVITGGVNPRYLSQIAAGENATTVLTADIQDIDVRTGRCNASLSASPGFKTDYDYDGLLPFSPGPAFNTPTFNSAAEGMAVTKLYKQIRQTYNQFQGGVFLGELGQTLRLLSRPTESFAKVTVSYLQLQKSIISKSARAKKGGSIGNAASQLRKNLAGNYLQWTFGVVPLMNDIKDISKTIQRVISDPPRERFTASGEHKSVVINTLAPITFGPIYCTRTEHIETISKVKYYGAYKVMDNEQAASNRLSRIQQLSGFTLRDFVPTIWNLLPYSFVADYFINIGDVLEALTTDTSVVKWISRTQVTTRVHTQRVTPNFGLSKASGSPTWVWYSFTGSPASFIATRKTINRDKAVVPNLGLRSKIEVRTGKKVLNLLALMLARR